MTYRVPCPSCQIVNVLNVTDLGKTLKCGACAGSFVFGDDILSDLKRKRREQEEREEREREAAEADRLGREAAAREAAAAIRHEDEEKEEHERLMRASPETAPPMPQAPAYAALEVTSGVLVIVGLLTIVGSIVGGIGTMLSGGERHDPGAVYGGASLFCGGALSGLFMAAFGQGLSALRDIARNSWRH